MSLMIFTTVLPKILITLTAAAALRPETNATVIKSVLRSGVTVRFPTIERAVSLGSTDDWASVETGCMTTGDLSKLTRV